MRQPRPSFLLGLLKRVLIQGRGLLRRMPFLSNQSVLWFQCSYFTNYCFLWLIQFDSCFLRFTGWECACTHPNASRTLKTLTFKNFSTFELHECRPIIILFCKFGNHSEICIAEQIKKIFRISIYWKVFQFLENF